MNAAEIIVYIVFAIIAIGSVVIGILYASSGKKMDSTAGHQKNFMKHRGILGVQDKGMSMDDKKIYVVGYEKLGF